MDDTLLMRSAKLFRLSSLSLILFYSILLLSLCNSYSFTSVFLVYFCFLLTVFPLFFLSIFLNWYLLFPFTAVHNFSPLVLPTVERPEQKQRCFFREVQFGTKLRESKHDLYSSQMLFSLPNYEGRLFSNSETSFEYYRATVKVHVLTISIVITQVFEISFPTLKFISQLQK
jgi:hypothetical protein